MRNIIKSLIDFIKVCAQHPIGTLLAFLLLAMLVFGWHVAGNIEVILKYLPTTEEQRNRFEQALNAEDLIDTELEAIRRALNADRILLTRFHVNSNSTDVSGSPISLISITNSAMAPGVTLDSRMTQPIPISAFTGMIREIWSERDRPRCIVKSINEVDTPALRARLESRGVQVVFACPMSDRTGTPSGMVVAEYLRTETERPSNTELMRELAASVNRIEGYLALSQPPPHRHRLW